MRGTPLQGCQYPESKEDDSCEILTRSISWPLPDTHIMEDKDSNSNPPATSRQGQLSQGSPDSMVQSHLHNSSAAATKGYRPSSSTHCPWRSFTLLPLRPPHGHRWPQAPPKLSAWGQTFHNILSFMPQILLDTISGHEWKEKARTIKSFRGRNSVSSSHSFQNDDL